MLMKKYGAFILSFALLTLLFIQVRIASNLRSELAAARAENERLEPAIDAATVVATGGSRAGSNADTRDTEAVSQRLQDLESEVMRLRGVAARALRAEAEV